MHSKSWVDCEFYRLNERLHWKYILHSNSSTYWILIFDQSNGKIESYRESKSNPKKGLVFAKSKLYYTYYTSHIVTHELNDI